VSATVPDVSAGGRVHTGLHDRPLDVGAAHAFVADPRAGASVVFTGTVRDHAEGRAVSGLSYEAYREVAERKLAELAETLAGREGICAVWMEHRVGELTVGEPSVVVAVSAGHRPEAFDCCREGIDTLKAEIPIWKQEHWDAGGAHWPGTD
jgi:molybdopterin synthase catalytic subunit